MVGCPEKVWAKAKHRAQEMHGSRVRTTESPVGAGNEAVLAGAMPRAPASRTVELALDIS